MLDPKLIRQSLQQVAQQLKKRGFSLDIDALGALEAERKTWQMKAESLQNERNTRSKSIGQAKAKG